ncbi:hypothetical protein IJF89_02055 [Candidatus Saccharibacteria bacterium]|nr:hypothetical protein [Candidatus Saccharibacteria bacterium]
MKSPKTSPAKTTQSPKKSLCSRLGHSFGRLFGAVCGFFAGVFRAPR